MLENILPSLITGVLALVGIIFTNIMSNKQIEHKLEINQATMNVKLDNIAAEVQRHSEGIQQVPVLVEQVKNLERRVESVENQLSKG
jgi:hypothetical protein